MNLRNEHVLERGDKAQHSGSKTENVGKTSGLSLRSSNLRKRQESLENDDEVFHGKRLNVKVHYKNKSFHVDASLELGKDAIAVNEAHLHIHHTAFTWEQFETFVISVCQGNIPNHVTYLPLLLRAGFVSRILQSEFEKQPRQTLLFLEFPRLSKVEKEPPKIFSREYNAGDLQNLIQG